MQRVRWTDEAGRQLLAIISRLAEKDAKIAELLLLRINKLIAIAVESPELYPAGRIATTREIHPYPDYTIVFRHVSQLCEILAVLPASHVWPLAGEKEP